MTPSASAAAGMRSAAIRFADALRDPNAVQEQLLARIVRRNAATVFGRTHGFAWVRTLDDYRRAVPIRTYEEHLPWLGPMVDGAPNQLVAEPVLAFERTTGSSGANKMIPMTGSLIREFRAALHPWLYDLYGPAGAGRLAGTRAYWAISPWGRAPERTAGGTPIGMPDETVYFGRRVGMALGAMLAVAPGVGAIADLDDCRYVTARLLASARDLGFVAVWSPTFATLLLDALHEHRDEIASDIAGGTLAARRRLPGGVGLQAPPPDPARAALLSRSGGIDLGVLWPKLAVVSAWADGASAPFAADLRERLRGTGARLQPKGILATEGAISVPIDAFGSPALAVTSHVLELLPLDSAETTPIDQAEVGADYEIVMTTGGGLYRYRLGDVVRVTGHAGRTPLVRLAERRDGRVDLVGEKLSVERVDAVLDAAWESLATRERPPFMLLAPEAGPPIHFTLFVDMTEGVAAALARAVETRLLEGHHYALCRGLGQLGPVAGSRVKDGYRRFEARCVGLGQRAGTVKPVRLDRRMDWREALARAEGLTSGTRSSAP